MKKINEVINTANGVPNSLLFIEKEMLRLAKEIRHQISITWFNDLYYWTSEMSNQCYLTLITVTHEWSTVNKIDYVGYLRPSLVCHYLS